MSPTGHLAVGFAAKRIAPEMPIPVLLLAAYAIDLLYFVFIAIGLERQDFDPWSHSLAMAIVWSAAAGLATTVFSHKSGRNFSQIVNHHAFREFRNGSAVALVVFSHWILDFIVWDNLTVSFNQSQHIGLGLYNRIGFSLTGTAFDSGTIIATVLEISMLITGLVTYILYVRMKRKTKSES